MQTTNEKKEPELFYEPEDSVNYHARLGQLIALSDTLVAALGDSQKDKPFVNYLIVRIKEVNKTIKNKLGEGVYNEL